VNNASHLSEIIKGEISRFVNIFVNILVDKYENGTIHIKPFGSKRAHTFHQQYY